MIFLIKALQLIFSLSILIVLHELGHFIPAKLFKTRVEKFYLFFDPWFSIFKKKVGDTEYGIGWLPLGGYVKISGMIDESMDKEQMKKPAEKWEFRAKPAWQRLVIMVGGVVVNLLLGIFIYAMTMYWYGDKYLPNENLKDGVWCTDSLSLRLGFQNGDKIVSVDGEKVIRFSSIVENMLDANTVQIERDGNIETIDLPNNFIEQLIANKGSLLFYPRIPTVIGAVVDGSNAMSAGLKNRDVIVAVNGKNINYFDEFKNVLSSQKGNTISLTLKRDGERKKLSVKVDDDGKIGFTPAQLTIEQLGELGVYEVSSYKYGFFASIPAGYRKAIAKLGSYIDQFKLILQPSTGAYKGMGGFGTIGSLFPSSWDWEIFWNLTAFLSLMLAFMNILPIPALDGGHVMFLLYEIIVGRPAPEKVVEHAQVIGMIILLTLLVFANGNDILRLF